MLRVAPCCRQSKTGEYHPLDIAAGWSLRSRWITGKMEGQRATVDEWLDGGVTFVAIFRGSLFFTCSDKERGWNKMAQRKKLWSTETEGEHKVQTNSNPQSVCVFCEYRGQEWTYHRREMHKFPVAIQKKGDKTYLELAKERTELKWNFKLWTWVEIVCQRSASFI